VRDVLVRANADAEALREGRVFVALRRVRRDDERVRDGDVVEVAPPRPPRADGIRILVKTSDLVAVDKPAGVPTIPDHGGSAHALVALAATVLGIRESALHPTSRLDRDVSGVVIFALNRDAARRLVRARVDGLYERRYVAIAARAPSADGGTWDAPIGRARDPRLRTVGGREAIEAATRYAVSARAPSGAVLLALAPLTGRTHQIRVHAAHAGAPVIGDRTYGGPARITLASGRVVEPRRIALHAARVVVPDEHGSALAVLAPIPPDIADLWLLLGGAPDAWQAATSCALG
jgi:23S rRNA pseudouridine1911/1915/1917 synthase